VNGSLNAALALADRFGDVEEGALSAGARNQLVGELGAEPSVKAFLKYHQL
jgi:hypothetical protein